MMIVKHQIRISDETMARLKALAEPFSDREPKDVILRLLDEHERSGRGKPTGRKHGSNGEDRMIPAGFSTKSRVPRERGAIAESAVVKSEPQPWQTFAGRCSCS